MLLATKLAFSILPGGSSAGGTLVNPGAGDAAVYTYSPTSHRIVATRTNRRSQGINHVLLYGLNGQEKLPTLIAEAIDPADTKRIADNPHIVHDLQC